MSRRGFTLVELIIGVPQQKIVMAIALPRIGDAMVAQNARAGRDAVASQHAKARAVAIQRGRSTRLVFNGNSMVIVSRHPVTGAVDTVGNVEDLLGRFGVTVATTRDTLAFDARGLGTESNATTITVTRAAQRLARERKLIDNGPSHSRFDCCPMVGRFAYATSRT